VLDVLQASGVSTIGIGKIDDLFSGRGLQEKIHINLTQKASKKLLKLEINAVRIFDG